MKNVTLPLAELEKFLRKTIAHLPESFEVVGVELGPRSRPTYVRFRVEAREPGVGP